MWWRPLAPRPPRSTSRSCSSRPTAIVFCFDGDEAGRRAAWRALENCLGQLVDGKEVAFAFLPEGEDPDSYVRKAGRESFEASDP